MFSEKEKLVFCYSVGGETRWADPLAVRRALLRESGGEFWSWWSESVEPEEFPTPPPPPPQALKPGDAPPPAAFAYAHSVAAWMKSLDSAERVLGCVRRVFGLPEFDTKTGEGVPESACWEVLQSMTEWLEKNVRKPANGQNTSPPDFPPPADSSSTIPPS